MGRNPRPDTRPSRSGQESGAAGAGVGSHPSAARARGEGCVRNAPCQARARPTSAAGAGATRGGLSSRSPVRPSLPPSPLRTPSAAQRAASSSFLVFPSRAGNNSPRNWADSGKPLKGAENPAPCPEEEPRAMPAQPRERSHRLRHPPPRPGHPPATAAA